MIKLKQLIYEGIIKVNINRQKRALHEAMDLYRKWLSNHKTSLEFEKEIKIITILNSTFSKYKLNNYKFDCNERTHGETDLNTGEITIFVNRYLIENLKQLKYEIEITIEHEEIHREQIKKAITDKTADKLDRILITLFGKGYNDILSRGEIMAYANDFSKFLIKTYGNKKDALEGLKMILGDSLDINLPYFRIRKLPLLYSCLSDRQKKDINEQYKQFLKMVYKYLE